MDLTIIVDPAGVQFSKQDFDKTIVYLMHTETTPLAMTVNERIQNRTAKDTGALTDDEAYQLIPDTSNEDLIRFYPTGIAQVLEWGRLYAQYIEGGSLGDTSPTISNPSEMYARAEVEDLDFVVAWADATIEQAAGLLTAGMGLIV